MGDVNICCQSLGGTDISHSNETSTATTNKQKTFTLLRWKWKTCFLQHARMQNQIQRESKKTLNTTQLRQDNTIL